MASLQFFNVRGRKAYEMMNLREGVMGQCSAEWRKVARVISLAHREAALPDDDESLDLIAHTLVELVCTGELEANGDLSDWRQSEVRLSVA